MPPIERWEAFFAPDSMLDALACNDVVGDAAEFGCGYGTFTTAAAPRISGNVFTTDIDPDMVSTTLARATTAGLQNVIVEHRDFVTHGSGRPDGSVSYVMLFNILHMEDPIALLREAFRVVRADGIVSMVHWRHDIATPRGPPPAIRPRPAQCRQWAESAGLRWSGSPDLPGSPWHWGMIFKRPAS